MWIFPSRGRPQNIDRLIKAYQQTGAITPVWLRLDDDDPQPDHKCEYWTVEKGPRLPLSEIYNEAFKKFPNEPWYGFISDDVVPKTHGWDWALITAAGSYGMAVPAGGDTTGGTPHFVIGGQLVRSMGWLALLGLDRLYIDTVWADIARERGVLRFLPEVVLEHRHFSNKKALFDRTYVKNSKKQDKIIYQTWKRRHHARYTP